MTDATGQLDVFQAYTNVMRQSVLTAIGRSYYNTPAWNLAISQDTQLGAMQRNIQAAAGVNTFNGAALASANTSAEVTIGHWADSTTSVATLTYEFFTGKTPTSAGYDYLVASPVNMTDLSDVYYLQFNLENRYINFASNLGKAGEGAAAFKAAYGDLTLLEATRKAYATIFGSTPDDAKVHALVDGRADYFAYYGQDGQNGIGTKAAMVGWLLAEAVKADTGAYATANDSFLVALASGTAVYNTDLLTTYGHPVVTTVGSSEGGLHATGL